MSARFRSKIAAELGWVAAMLAVVGAPLSLPAQPLPKVREVVHGVVQRAQRAAEEHSSAVYRYERTTVTREYDGKGRLQETEEKKEDMVFRQGSFYRKPLVEEGRTVVNEQLREDAAAASPDYEAVEGIAWEEYKRSRRGDYTQFLNSDLMARYDFTIRGRTNLNGRATLEVWFQPKTRRVAPRQLIDRVFNEVGGTLWVDEEELEVARATIALASPVTLLGGLAAIIRTGTFTLERVRVGDGVWFNQEAKGEFAGRKLLESKRIHIHSVSKTFRLVEAEGETASVAAPAGELSSK